MNIGNSIIQYHLMCMSSMFPYFGKFELGNWPVMNRVFGQLAGRGTLK